MRPQGPVVAWERPDAARLCATIRGVPVEIVLRHGCYEVRAYASVASVRERGVRHSADGWRALGVYTSERSAKRAARVAARRLAR